MRTIAAFLCAALTAPATTWYLTIAGLGGEQDYETRFRSQSAEIEKLLKATPDSRVQTLDGEAATRAALQSALDGIARDAKPEDAFVLTLIGHGTFDGEQYKFNLRGPDVTDREVAAMLDRVRAGRQLVVNTSSASGASLQALGRPNRTVVTATKSGTERNAPVFARFWVEALRDPAADSDKNETITAAEAFRFAELKTKQFYETSKLIATEHPQLSGQDGRFALLRLGATHAAAQDPAKRELLSRREQLENKIDLLKLQKAAMPTDEYKRQLQTLLLELARTQAELDK